MSAERFLHLKSSPVCLAPLLLLSLGGWGEGVLLQMLKAGTGNMNSFENLTLLQKSWLDGRGPRW